MKAFPRDVEVETMKVRHIGVESELQVGNGSDQTVPRDLEKEIKRHGLFQSVGWDGGGREFRTNPISIKSLRQVRGYKYLSEYFDSLKSRTTVISSGGTHIHISILDKDHPNMESNATAMGIAFYKQFQKIAGRNSSWAPMMERRTIQDVQQYLAGQMSIHTKRAYYSKGWILSPTSHKTLEFRGPRGSHDKLEVLAWIEFLENVVKAANRKCIDGIQFKQLVQGERVSEYMKSFDKSRKLTKSELEQTFNGAQLI